MSGSNCANVMCGKAKVGRPSPKGVEWYCSQACLDSAIRALRAARKARPPEHTALYESVCFACNRVAAGEGLMRLTQAQYLQKAQEYRRCQQPYCGGVLMLDPLDTVRHFSTEGRLRLEAGLA